jgi:hypothetical protein
MQAGVQDLSRISTAIGMLPSAGVVDSFALLAKTQPYHQELALESSGSRNNKQKLVVLSQTC